ncbi:hypothetical protein CU098_000276, partial [Rhizopus stolonifer]
LYTLNQLPLALKHYCKVLELCPDHVRALYGLQLCASKLTDQVDHAKALHELATERLLETYKNQPSKKLVQNYLLL